MGHQEKRKNRPREARVTTDGSSSRPAIDRWVFPHMQSHAYGWYAESFTDRSRAFTRNWIIEGTRVAGP